MSIISGDDLADKKIEQRRTTNEKIKEKDNEKERGKENMKGIHEKKISKSASTKEKRVRNDLLFLGFAVFVVFIVLFWVLQNPPSTTGIKINSGNKLNTTKGNIESFKESLLNADTLIIIDNVTLLQPDKARYVYACGAGLAGSWGKIGKDITKLYSFVIDGEECTYSSPKLVNNELSPQTITTTASECINKIEELKSVDPAFVILNIKYGSSYSIYETNTAYIFVDESFTEECSFRISSPVSSVLVAQ